jgi:dihydroceramide fatty acyl 2-hydroxylase
VAGVLAGVAVRKSQGKAEAKFKFDWNKPIVFQVGHLGEQYNEFIHTPQVLDEPARFFDSDFLEMFSRTPWYVVPIVWVPVVIAMLVYASNLGVSLEREQSIFCGGLALWTLIEYVLHRW